MMYPHSCGHREIKKKNREVAFLNIQENDRGL